MRICKSIFIMLALFLANPVYAVSVSSIVSFDSGSGEYQYQYELTNNADPSSNTLITEFFIPTFMSPDIVFVDGSLETLEFWFAESATPGTIPWDYQVALDPNSATYEPSGVDYSSASNILRFYRDVSSVNVLSLVSLRTNLSSSLSICNARGGDCDSIAQELAEVESTLDNFHSSNIEPGESLGGFLFLSLLEPATGPVLISAGDSTVYDSGVIPQTFGVVPLPGAFVLFASGLIFFIGKFGVRPQWHGNRDRSIYNSAALI